MPGGSDDRVRVVQLDLSNFGGVLPVAAATNTIILDNINIAYDGTPSSAQSSWFSIDGASSITLELQITKTLVPTSLKINLLTADSTAPSSNGQVEYDYWGDLLFPQAAIPSGGTGRKPTLTAFNLKAQAVAVQIVATGVSGVNFFTVANAKIYY